MDPSNTKTSKQLGSINTDAILFLLSLPLLVGQLLGCILYWSSSLRAGLGSSFGGCLQTRNEYHGSRKVYLVLELQPLLNYYSAGLNAS